MTSTTNSIRISLRTIRQHALRLPSAGLGTAMLTLFVAWLDGTSVRAQADDWRSSVGLTLMATEGNSDTLSLGLDAQLERRPRPWGFDARAKALTQRDDDNVSAERYIAEAGVERLFSRRVSWFASGAVEQDERSGLELRSELATGVGLTLAEGPRTWLSFELGITINRETPVVELADGATDGSPVELDERLQEQDFIGAIAALDYELRFGTDRASSFRQRLEIFPNFDNTDDFRAVAESALRVAFTESFAVELGLEVRYDAEPLLRRNGGALEELESTDIATSFAIVYSR